MDRESQQPRVHSPTWPPGLIVGSARSLVLERAPYGFRDLSAWLGRHGRAGSTVIVLAVCAFSFGYGVTDHLCTSDSQMTIGVRSESGSTRQPAEKLTRTAASLLTEARDEHANPGVERNAQLRAAAIGPVGRAEQQGTRLYPRERATTEFFAHATAGLSDAVQRKAASVAKPRPGSAGGDQRARTDRMKPELPPMAADASAGSDPSTGTTSVARESDASVHEPLPSVQALPPAASVPKQPAIALPALPPTAASANVAAIESLYVEGSLTPRIVNRGVSRLLPQYERCSEFCDSTPQRLKLSAVIDESGHGRQVVVEGLSRPVLRHCLEQATAHLSVPAPDTGTARARWVVRFIHAGR